MKSWKKRLLVGALAMALPCVGLATATPLADVPQWVVAKLFPCGGARYWKHSNSVGSQGDSEGYICHQFQCANRTTSLSPPQSELGLYVNNLGWYKGTPCGTATGLPNAAGCANCYTSNYMPSTVKSSLIPKCAYPNNWSPLTGKLLRFTFNKGPFYVCAGAHYCQRSRGGDLGITNKAGLQTGRGHYPCGAKTPNPSACAACFYEHPTN